MKVSRQLLERIIVEELLAYMGRNLNEAPSRTTALDLEDLPDEPDPREDPPTPEDAPENPTGMPELGLDDPNEIPGEADPSDDELEGDVTGDIQPIVNSVANDLKGKKIETISFDKKSALMPGASEVTITFEDEPDAFRVLLASDGEVKFFYKGLHNELEPFGAEELPEPNEEEPEKLPHSQGPNDRDPDFHEPPEENPEEDDDDGLEDLEIA